MCLSNLEVESGRRTTPRVYLVQTASFKHDSECTSLRALLFCIIVYEGYIPSALTQTRSIQFSVTLMSCNIEKVLEICHFVREALKLEDETIFAKQVVTKGMDCPTF